jgi:hypothetical protein
LEDERLLPMAPAEGKKSLARNTESTGRSNPWLCRVVLSSCMACADCIRTRHLHLAEPLRSGWDACHVVLLRNDPHSGRHCQGVNERPAVIASRICCGRHTVYCAAFFADLTAIDGLNGVVRKSLSDDIECLGIQAC